MSVSAAEWLALLGREYLDDFVRAGGAAVKLATVADPGRGDVLLADVEAAAAERGYLTARVDAAQVRVHMMQDVFFAVARQVEWRELARRAVRGYYAAAGYNVPGDDLSAEGVARHNGLDSVALHVEMRRAIEDVLRRGELAKDLRFAILWLCMAEVWPRGSVRPAVILEWLQGELRLVSALRDYLIFRKIGRHNARAMLSSLGAWTRMVGGPGLLLTMDLRRLTVPRRAEVADGQYYTAAAVMDAYEVLRQLIDATDDLAGVLVVVLAEPGMFEHEKRGAQNYVALYERVWHDVRLRQRDNPLSALTRMSEEGEGS